MHRMYLPSMGNGRVLLMRCCAVLIGGALACQGSGEGDPFSGPPKEFPPAPLDPTLVTIPYTPRPAGTLTYVRDIEPLIALHCAECHAGGTAQGRKDLTSYSAVRDAAASIRDSIQSGAMPPWLPEHGYTAFAGERHLTRSQIGLIDQWMKEGMAEGDPSSVAPGGTQPLSRTEASPPPRAIALWLGQRELQVPAGGPPGPLYDRYVVTEDIELYAVTPEVGELATDLKAWVLQPDGSRDWILRVPRWSPDRAERYYFQEPMFLPQGTIFALEFSYAAPEASQSSSGALELIVLPVDPEDRGLLLAESGRWTDVITPEPPRLGGGR